MTQFNKTTAEAALVFAAIIATTIMAFLVITSNIVSLAAASTTNSNTTTTSPSPSGIELSPQPIYEERSPEPNITPINQTHATLTFSGNGMLTLPNTAQTINTTSNGTGIISFITSSGYAKETIRTEDGSENATATFYEIVQFNPTALGGGKGIVTAVFQTNSTGMLAPLNGMIAIGIDNVTSSGESHVTLWRWETGGITSSNNNNNSTDAMVPPSAMQGEPPVNTTTTMTNATTSDTNTTRATGKEQQQQPTILTIPSWLWE
jgi:hypothetical protein